MEIKITSEIVSTVCNSLRASRTSLKQQLKQAKSLQEESKITIIEHQLLEVEEALQIFNELDI